MGQDAQGLIVASLPRPKHKAGEGILRLSRLFSFRKIA
jgi:hypothetical protein